MEQQSHRILIVDSDERALKVIENFLLIDGFDVKTACGAEKALNSLRSGGYDLVLVDEHFADLTLSCFLEKLLRIPQKGTVLVMGSAAFHPCGTVPCNPHRANRFVRKGRPCEILEAVHEMLRCGSA